MSVTAPVLNINGASADMLLEGYEKAYRVLRELLGAMGDITPHGRDYQTVDKEVYDRAREEHVARIVALHKIEREIIELAQAVQKQQAEREKIRSHSVH